MGTLAVIKTKETKLVEGFINLVNDDGQPKDSFILLKLMQKALKEKPKKWSS